MTTSLKLHQANAEIFVPDSISLDSALKRTRIIGIGAHPDDLEIMAYPGIIECFRSAQPSFLGVTCTDGAGSPRQGPYASVTDADMQKIRWNEQNQAASLGRYSAMLQLKHSSKTTKSAATPDLTNDLESILRATSAETIFTHNLLDKHDTHVAVALRTIEALRRLPLEKRPKHLYGIEVWRSLDWLPDDLKILFDLDTDQHLAPALLGIFDSQIGGGKRYDLAVPARWRSNATYQESHATDEHEFVTIGVDMSPLISAAPPSVESFTEDILKRFREDVQSRIHRLSHG